MKYLIMALFSLFAVSEAMATIQFRDRIIYQGKEYVIQGVNPLEPYFNKFPEKRPKSRSTALWRGYIATFEVGVKGLCIRDVEVIAGYTDGKPILKSILKEVFDDEYLLKIDWYTGLLVLMEEKHFHNYNLDLGYILLEFKNGCLTETRSYTNKEYQRFSKRQFEAFKQTEEYRSLKKELLEKERRSEESIEDLLRIFVIDYSSKILVD